MTDYLSDAAVCLLLDLSNRAMRGRYPRPKDSPERRELKRAGLICSDRPSQTETNRHPYWRPTLKGEEIADTIRHIGA